MAVRVDETGGDDLASRLVDTARLGGRNVCRDGRNLVALDRDVHHRRDLLSRVDDAAAFDHEIERRSGPSPSSRRRCTPAGLSPRLSRLSKCQRPQRREHDRGNAKPLKELSPAGS